MCDSGFRDASTEEVMAIARRNAEKWRGTLDLLAKYDQGDSEDFISNEPDGTYISSRIPRGINPDGSVRY